MRNRRRFIKRCALALIGLVGNAKRIAECNRPRFNTWNSGLARIGKWHVGITQGQTLRLVVDRENVIAGTDCGLGGRVHTQIAWAKLETIGKGAELASKELWG